MKTYRDGSTVAESYNSGLVVFLYDESYSGAINDAGPKILEYLDDESHEDPALIKLAGDGMLAVFEMVQDDELAVEVSVGPPLSVEELKDFPTGLVPDKAFLRIPTGKLCIEGYDSLRLGPEAEYAEEEGSVVDVPPGDYTLTVYREDPFHDDDDEDETDGRERPNHVVTLSDPAEYPPPDGRQALMRCKRE